MLLITIDLLQAQEDDNSDLFKNSVYIELLGNGFKYSINYERNIFNGGYLINNLRMGIGHIEGDSFVIPIEYLFVKGYFFSFFELGLGYSPIIEFDHKYYEDYDYEINMRNENGYTKVTHNFISRIGYKYQGSSGFLFKVALTPRILVVESNEANFRFDLWGGISIGYSF